MTRIAYTRDNQDVTYSQLAANGIIEFLDYLTKHKSMEFVSLVSNSRLRLLHWINIDLNNSLVII